MLTYLSDPLPQVVCPMDEVAIPQNHFCSAPAHSEPSPPLSLFSSITPSSAKDGISGNRRSDDIQRVTAGRPEKQSNADTEATRKLPAQSLSLSKRQREPGRMVQASGAKYPRINGQPGVAFKDGFDAGLPEDGQNLQKTSQTKTSISPAENVATHSLHRSAQSLSESHMDSWGGVVGQSDIPNASSTNRWVIGPLFQSLKSKISSFTEIVITPVKVFRAGSSLPSPVNTRDDDKRQAFGTSSTEHSALSRVLESQAQGERETEDMKVTEAAPEAQTVHKCCKQLNMDSEQADGCPTTGTEESLFVPWQQSPCLSADAVGAFQSAGSVFTPSLPACLSVAVGASQESEESIPSAEEELEGKPAPQVKALPRKGAGNGKEVPSQTLVSHPKEVGSDPETADVQLPVPNSLGLDKDDPGRDETDLSDGRKSERSRLVGRSLQRCLKVRILRATIDNQLLEAPLDTQTRPAAAHGRPKRDPRGDAAPQNTVKGKRVRAHPCVKTQTQELQRPRRKRQAVPASGSKGGRDDGDVLTMADEAGHAETAGCGALDNGCGGPEESWKGSSLQVKPKKTRRLKTPPCPAGDDVDLETTIQVQSQKQAQPEGSAEVLGHPRELHRTRKCRESAKNPRKRTSPTHAGLCADSENAPLTRPVELGTVTPTERTTSGDSLEGRGLKQLSKRPRRALRSTTPGGSREVSSRTKENGSQGSKSQSGAKPVCLDVTPSESSPQSEPLPDCYVQLGQDVLLTEDGRKPDSASTNGSASVFRLHSRASKEHQRRKRAGLHSRRIRVEPATCVSQDDWSLAAPGKRASDAQHSRQLLRSFSCPEIPTLRSSEVPWNSLHSPHHARVQPRRQHARSGPPFPLPAHGPGGRARRHTVCSVELEREIAPLCLRKEVYPSRRSPRYDAPGLYPSAGHGLPPSPSLSALASCFLSSPLAFLCKKAEGRGASASPASSSPTSSSLLPLSPTAKHLSGLTQQPDPFMDPSGGSGQCESQRGRPCDVDDDGENTSSSSQELEDVGLREEKALSDSEVKVLRKVSSIRIRKTLPKPQNNLTPMGLPKAVRVKKKDFSLEEIYTNKNFNKPRESRLETIFEVPASRKNGSVCSFGQKRIKRFLEFPEVGEARKPKKPPVRVGQAGASGSRTRRGGFPKDAAALGAQDVDALLCAKLHQLNLWLIQDQSDG